MFLYYYLLSKINNFYFSFWGLKPYYSTSLYYSFVMCYCNIIFLSIIIIIIGIKLIILGESIWTQNYGNMTMALQTDIPEEVDQVKLT